MQHIKFRQTTDGIFFLFYHSAILTNGNADSISQIKKDCFHSPHFL